MSIRTAICLTGFLIMASLYHANAAITKCDQCDSTATTGGPTTPISTTVAGANGTSPAPGAPAVAATQLPPCSGTSIAQTCAATVLGGTTPAPPAGNTWACATIYRGKDIVKKHCDTLSAPDLDKFSKCASYQSQTPSAANETFIKCVCTNADSCTAALVASGTDGVPVVSLMLVLGSVMWTKINRAG